MKLIVTLYRDEAGWIVAECPALPGCLSQGRTREEALVNIEDAMHGWLAVKGSQVEDGLKYPLDIEVTEVEVAV